MEREFEEGRVLDVAHATILCWGSAARRDGRPAPSSGDRDRPAHRPPPPGEASRWIGVTTWSRSSRPAAGLRRAAGGRGACFAARPPNCQQDRGRVRARHSTTRPSTPRSDVGGARAQAVGAATAGRRPRRAASVHGRPPGRGTRRLLVRKARRSSPGGCGQARLWEADWRRTGSRSQLGPGQSGYHGTTPPSRARLQALARCNYLPRIRPRATGALGSSGRRGATPANDCPAHGRPS